MITSRLVVIACLTLAASLSAQSFSATTIIPPLPQANTSLQCFGTDNGAISSWADYDNDGDLDILLTERCQTNIGTRFYRNDGRDAQQPEAWRFAEIGTLVDRVYGTIDWGDFDNDGDLDVLLGGEEAAHLFRNEVSGFVEVTQIAATGEGCAAFWGDFDNDGDLDIVTASRINNNRDSKLYENIGGQFRERAGFDKASSAGWADYDTDGDLDLLFGGAGSVSKLYQNTNGLFEIIEEFPIGSGNGGIETSAVAWGDFNHDGNLDLIITGDPELTSTVEEATRLYRNDGGPSGHSNFTDLEFSHGVDGIVHASLAWGDCDNDGRLDLLVSAPFAGIYRNLGDNRFKKIALPFSLTFGLSASWGDLDSDGRLDILTGSKIYQSDPDSTRANLPPGPPQNLTASISGRSVTLSWDPASDDFTPLATLSYALRLGTNSGGNDIVDPKSTSDGRRKVAELGNVNLNRTWTVKTLSEGRYFWSVQAIDQAFAGSHFSEQKTFIIGSPVIEHTAIPTTDAGQDLVIEAAITDTIDSGVQRARLNYREGGSNAFVRLEMATINNTYRATIPRHQVNSHGLEYFIVAEDSALTTREPETGEFPVLVNVQSLQKDSPQPGGSAQTAYRLFSVPMNLLEKDPFTNLEDDLGPYSRPEWRVFEFLPSQRISESPSELHAGRAYWLIVKNGEKTLDFGPSRTFPTNREFAIPLYLGWTLIGNPFNFDIPFENLRLASGQSLDIRSYDGTWRGATSPMKPFEGYAVANDSTFIDTIYVNPVLSAPSGELAKSNPIDLHGEWHWSIRISAECQQARDTDNIAAVAVDAAPDFDVYDQPEPPVIGEYVSIYFSHDHWPTPFEKFSLDVRPEPVEGEIWEFSVRSNIHDKIRLTFSGLNEVPDHLAIWLADPILGVGHDLRESNQYFVAGGTEDQPKRLKLVVGKREFVDRTFENRAVPTVFELSQNFPNPFNPATTIRYGLPENDRVTLKVFNLQGKEVATLMSGENQRAGYHVAVWDGRNQRNLTVASGVYLYQLRTSRFSMVRKMLLVK